MLSSKKEVGVRNDGTIPAFEGIRNRQCNTRLLWPSRLSLRRRCHTSAGQERPCGQPPGKTPHYPEDPLSMDYHSEHYHDYMEEQAIEELYEEMRAQAIEEFTEERLQAYYLANKLLAKPAVDFLSQARTVRTSNSTAGFLLAAIAIEVGLKATLIKPIVYGLVHAESVASLITDLTLSPMGLERYRELLFQLLKMQGGTDLKNYQRQDSRKTLWEEILEVKKLRNATMHRAQSVMEVNTALALGVASVITETIFPSVLRAMDLHLHDGYRICDDSGCKLREMIAARPDSRDSS